MKTKLLIPLILSSFLFNTSCFDELFGEDEEYTYEDDGNGNLRAGYDFTFYCATGSSSTVPIPEETPACQAAYEYFAKVYGCNDADNFNEANCRMCHDCGYQNYCTVCH